MADVKIIECEHAGTFKVSTLMSKFGITKEQARALKDTGCVEIKQAKTSTAAKVKEPDNVK